MGRQRERERERERERREYKNIDHPQWFPFSRGQEEEQFFFNILLRIETNGSEMILFHQQLNAETTVVSIQCKSLTFKYIIMYTYRSMHFFILHYA